MWTFSLFIYIALDQAMAKVLHPALIICSYYLFLPTFSLVIKNLLLLLDSDFPPVAIKLFILPPEY